MSLSMEITSTTPAVGSGISIVQTWWGVDSPALQAAVTIIIDLLAAS